MVHVVGVVAEQEGHHQAVGEGAAAADGHQGIHVGRPVDQGREAAQKIAPAKDQHRDGQDQLQDGVVHRVAHHGEELRQRQRRRQHLAHGDVEQQRGEDRRPDEAVLLGTVGGVLLRLLGLLGLRRGLVLVEGGAEARLRDFRDDVLRLGLLLVIGDGQDAGGEVHVAALHPRQTAGHPLHRGAARGAVHPRDVVFFLAHGQVLSPAAPPCFRVRQIPPGGIFYSRTNIYPWGVFCQEGKSLHLDRFLGNAGKRPEPRPHPGENRNGIVIENLCPFCYNRGVKGDPRGVSGATPPSPPGIVNSVVRWNIQT